MALLIKFVLYRRNKKLEDAQQRLTAEEWAVMPEIEKNQINFRFCL